MTHILRKIALAGLVLPLLAILSACSSDSGYTPAERLTNAQVYFPNTLDSIVGLERAADSFYVEIDRINTEGDLIVPLVVESDTASTFVFPSSVTFKDGEAKANIAIAYSSMDMEYDDMHPVQISIDNKDYTTPYGDVTYSFKAGLQAPWSDWSLLDLDGNEVLGKIGTGTYTYSLLWADTQKGMEVYFRQNTVNPAQVQFALHSWGEGVTLILDGIWSSDYQKYLLTLDKSYTGLTDDSYGEVFVEDLASYQGYTVGTQDWYSYPSSYDPETGTFNLCLIYFVAEGYFGYGMEYLQMDGFYVYDYSVTSTWAGILKDPQGSYSSVIDVTFGQDVNYAKYAVSDISVSANTLASNIMDGKVKTTKVTKEGRINVPLTESGKYRFVIVTYDADGNACKAATCAYEFEANGSNWKSLGLGAYRDDYLTRFYQIDNQFYEVEIQESSTTPGLYRLVYPYGEVFPLNQDGDYDTSLNYYLEIHAEDPDGVYIDKQTQGLDWGRGNMTVWSYASYYMSMGYALSDIKSEGMCGTLKDGVITFPTSSLLISFPDYESGKFYSANESGQFALYLPEAYERLLDSYTKSQVFSKHKTSAHNMKNPSTPMDTSKHFARHKLYHGQLFHVVPVRW